MYMYAYVFLPRHPDVTVIGEEATIVSGLHIHEYMHIQ